jgi:hypothetical protein
VADGRIAQQLDQTVYDDAKALAAAYQSPPAYPD